jgi:hypothetical protein
MQANPELAEILRQYIPTDAFAEHLRLIPLSVRGKMTHPRDDRVFIFEGLTLGVHPDDLIGSALDPKKIPPLAVRHVLSRMLVDSHILIDTSVDVEITEAKFYFSKDPEHDRKLMDYFFPPYAAGQMVAGKGTGIGT